MSELLLLDSLDIDTLELPEEAAAVEPKRRGQPRKEAGSRQEPSSIISGVGCPSADPHVLLAAAVIDKAIRDVSGYWQEDGRAPWAQPEQATDALRFLVKGVEGVADPFFYHTVAGVDCITDLQPGELLRLLLANRRKKAGRPVADAEEVET